MRPLLLMMILGLLLSCASKPPLKLDFVKPPDPTGKVWEEDGHVCMTEEYFRSLVEYMMHNQGEIKLYKEFQ